MANLGSAVLELRTDLRPLAAGVKEGEVMVGASLQRMEAMTVQHMSKIGATLSQAGTSSRQLAVGHGDATGSLAAYATQANATGTALRGEGRAASDASAATAGLTGRTRESADAHTRVSGAVRGSTAAHAGLKNGIQQTAYAAQAFDGRLGGLGRSLDEVGRHAQAFKSQGIDYVAAGLASGAVAFIAYGTKANIAFDSVGKAIQRQAGTSREVTGQLLNDVRQVGEQAPDSWQKIGDAVAAQYRLFGSSNAQIKQNTDLFLAFAHQANMDVVPAVTAISNVFRLFHPAGMSAVDVMDQLVNLSQKTQRPLGDLLGIINKYGPQFQAMGLSFTQTIGLMQAFSAAGINATAMGRGLSAAVSRAAQEQKKGAAASADGGAKMLQYQDAVKTAQMRVDELNKKLASGKGDQAKYSQELGVAQDKLTVAKDKLDQYTTSSQKAGSAHLTISQIIAKESAAIEGATSKQQALNLAIAAFGPRLGPQMADALYHNKAGLDAMDKSLGDAHGKTEDLAKAQRDTLHGQLELLHHDFDLLASKVGLTSSALKGIVGDVASLVKAISSIPKPVLDLLVGGALAGGAATLLARHSPLGADAARLFGGGPTATAMFARTPVAQSRLGIGGTGIGGTQVAEMTVGTLIARSMVGGSGGGLPTKGGSAEKGLANTATKDAEQAAAREGGAASTGIMGAVRSAGPKIGSLMGGVMRVGMVSAVAAGLGDVVSHVIGGQAGKAVGKATQWGGLGASIGLEVGGPLGAAIGGAAGVGIGLAVSLIHKHNYGRDIADSVFKNFGGREAAPGVARQMEDALNQANSIVKQHTRQTGLGSAFTTPLKPEEQATLNKHARDAGHLGASQLIAGWSQYKVPNPEVMWHQFTDLTKKFPRGQVGGQMRAEAAQEVLTYTRELVNQGKLPEKAYSDMLKRINRQFPGWRDQLKKWAVDSTRAFTSGLNLRQAETNTKTALNSMRGDFMQLPQVMDRTKGDMLQKSAAVVKSLQEIATKGGPNAKIAAQDIANLRASSNRDMADMQQKTDSHMAQLRDAIKHGSLDATNAAVTNVQTMMQQYKRAYDGGLIDSKTYWTGIQGNFSNGANAVKADTDAKYSTLFTNLNAQYARHEIDSKTFNDRKKQLFAQMTSDENTALSRYGDQMMQAMLHSGNVTTQGVKAMIDQFNGIIGPLGGQKIQYPASVDLSALGSTASVKTGQTVQTQNVGTKSARGGVFQFAGGGMADIGRPGTPGHDNVPLNVGGQNIAVGEGERVVVFNRHQIPQAEQRFARDGGMAGFFSSNTTPNYASRGGWSHYAGGGIVTASDFGGPGDPGTGSTGYRGDDLNQHPDSFAELNMGTALGNLPYMAGITVTLGGKTEQVFKRDIGAGGPGLNGHTRAVDLWYSAANAIGLSGLADVMVNGGAGVNVKISGGSGGAAPVVHVDIPKVMGAGLLTATTQKLLQKSGDEMNKKIDSMAPVSTGGNAPGTVMAQGGPPAIVQAAMFAAANQIAGRPYIFGGGHGSWSDSGYDCSGAVSYVLHAAGLLDHPEATGELAGYGDPGYGKYITIGVTNGGPGGGHTMMAMFGKFFESGGGPLGPHWDPGWDGTFQTYRHPRGYAHGGRVGDFGFVDPAYLLKVQPEISGVPAFQDYARRRGAGNILSARGGGHGLASGGILRAATGISTGGSGGGYDSSQRAFIEKYKREHHGHMPSKRLIAQHALKGKKPSKFDPAVVGNFPGASLAGYGGTNPFSLHDMDAVNQSLEGVFGLVGDSSSGGGDAKVMSDTIAHYTDLYSSALYPTPNFSSWNSPGDFVITKDPVTGQDVPPFISPNINTVGNELAQILGYQNQWVGDLTGALSLSQTLGGQVPSAIVYREKEVAAIRKKVTANIAKMKKLQANMKALTEYQKKIQAERKKKTPSRGAIAGWAQGIAKIRDENNKLLGIKTTKNDWHDYDNNDANSKELREDWIRWSKAVPAIQAENMGFVGDQNTIPTDPGGELGEIQSQLGLPAQGSAVERIASGGTSSTGLYQLRDTIKGWVDQIGGVNGDLAQQTLQRDLYQRGLDTLQSGASQALATAKSGSTSQNSELVDALKTALQEARAELHVGDAQAGVLGSARDLGFARGGMIRPFGGSFAVGGVVPGGLGQPIMIEAHGGEEVVPADQRDGRPVISQTFESGMEWLRDFVRTEVSNTNRTTSSQAMRGLPSRGGGAVLT